MRLIDADKLVERILFICDNDAFNCTLIGGLVLGVIDGQPTIEAEPVKRGRWIIKDDSYTYGIIRAVRWYECSNCGGIAYVEYPYCPHCGAGMKRALEGEGE